MVIDHFNDNLYSIFVSAHNRALTDRPVIASDSARAHVVAEPEGMKAILSAVSKRSAAAQSLLTRPRIAVLALAALMTADASYSATHARHLLALQSRLNTLLNGSRKQRIGRRRARECRVRRQKLKGGMILRGGKARCSYRLSKMNLIIRIYQLREEAGSNCILVATAEKLQTPKSTKTQANWLVGSTWLAVYPLMH